MVPAAYPPSNSTPEISGFVPEIPRFTPNQRLVCG
jgi:hypothetical protein